VRVAGATGLLGCAGPTPCVTWSQPLTQTHQPS
jgi:hypothetical protein